LVPFDRPHTDDDSPGPGSFDVLGFTHFWGKSRTGSWVVKRKTARSRFGRALLRVGAWCRKHLHDAVVEQHRHLVQALRGHYGISGSPETPTRSLASSTK
jgi:RNA-directed DNA polymerase